MQNSMYKIIKKYNVAAYAHCMQSLYEELLIFLEEKFPDGQIQFDSTERIVFLIEDLDYFVDHDFPGFQLYNLQLILRELNISNFFCAVVSNIPDYDRYTKKIRDILRPDDVPMRAISLSSGTRFRNKSPSSKKIEIEKIEYPYIVLSRLSRFHRTVFMSKLFDSDLHTKGMVSYHNIDVSNDKVPFKEIKYFADRSFDHPTFLTTTPFTYANLENTIKNATNIKLVNDFKSRIPRYCNFEENTDISNKSTAMEFQNDSIQQALVYIALETTVKYPAPYHSEISFKSIAQKRPFVIFGAPGCIKLLKNQGFQTFDQWWDESYDDERDTEKRLDMIIKIIQYLTSIDMQKIKKMCKEMEPLLEYNYQHLIGDFVTNELSNKDRILEQSFIKK